MNTQKIVEKYESNIALLSNVFGKFTDQIVYDSEAERAKQILYHVYGYKDIYAVCKPIVDTEKTCEYVKILNQYYGETSSNTEWSK